jgi:glycolate oxidase FAD binding subunit
VTAGGDTAGALAEVCGTDAVRAAGEGDTVGGRQPRWVARPESVAVLAGLMRVCDERELTVVARGEGTKLDWGRPPTTVDVLVDTGRLAGVYEHYVDDLVATVGAGTPLRAVQTALARHGQRVAIDPGSANATIGGILATGEAGPLRLGYGPPRDQLIGVEFVRADGTIARSGGRVVKNVAGYDLGKLLCGSYGTLALIASATFRLHPLPAAQSYLTRTVRSPMEAHELLQELIDSPVSPAAIEIDLPDPGGRTRRSAVGGRREPGGTLTVLLEGSVAGVAARAEETRLLLAGDTTPTPEPPPWWGRYPFGEGDVALKLAAPVADLYAAMYALHDAFGGIVPIRGSVGVGICYVGLPVAGPRPGALSGARVATTHAARQAARVTEVLDAVRTILLARGGTCVVLDAPAAVRDGLDMWGPVDGLDLMRAVKAQFDPDRRLAPGRFVGGI